MGNSEYIDVLGFGIVTVDFLGVVDNWPSEGTKLPLQNFCIYDGGLTATALVAVSRLGGRACFAGKLGYSQMAERALCALADENVDCSLVIREQNAEPVISFVITTAQTGQRTILWSSQNVIYPCPDELPDKKWYERTRVLLFDHCSEQAGVEMARIARKHNIPVVIDVERETEYVSEAMAISSHVIVSENFAAKYTRESNVSQMLRCLRTWPQQTVIITQGKSGCTGFSGQGEFHVPAIVVEAVDTTGCGDVFHGAYALAIARGKTVIQAARYASAVAAMCATKFGGRDGIPNQNDLNEFMQ
jgi:sugar/nucleoside kinase (ribokinase family)